MNNNNFMRDSAPSPKKSLLLTGAPTTGKTTVHRKILEHGFTTIPDETTRPIRPGEVDGVDKVFITVDEFIKRFNLNWYIEPTLEFTVFNENHYGTPRRWLEDAKQDGKRIAVITVSTEIARTVKLALDDEILWVHLEANEEVRRKRLSERGISDEEISYRLTKGDSILRIDDADIVIDTSQFTLEECLEIIKKKILTS